MTNFKQVKFNNKRGGNIKDGHRSDCQTKVQAEANEARWLAAGFIRRWIRNAPRLTYTWEGNFPIIELAPGVANDNEGQLRVGIVARHEKSDLQICFPYGTSPADIADQLDDEILKIMRIEDAPISWTPGDDFVNGRWMRI